MIVSDSTHIWHVLFSFFLPKKEITTETKMTFHFQQADKFRRLILFHLSVVRFQREVDSISNAKKNRLLHKILIIIFFFFFLRNVSFCLLDNIALRNRKQVASNASAIKEPSDKLRRNECRRLSYRRHSFTDCISELLVSKKTKKKHGHKQTNILHSKPKKKKKKRRKRESDAAMAPSMQQHQWRNLRATSYSTHKKLHFGCKTFDSKWSHTERETLLPVKKKKKKHSSKTNAQPYRASGESSFKRREFQTQWRKKMKITKNLRNTKIRMRWWDVFR